MQRWLGCFVVAVLAAGCSSTAASDGRVSVAAGFFPLAEAARIVGGSTVSVADLTPPGVEPHDLELTPSQVRSLQDADVALLLGRGFQPSLEASAAERKGATVELLDAIAVPRSSHDPHVWLDPRMMSTIVSHVGDALARARPSEAAGYRARADAFRAQLSTLDRDFADGLRTCARRTIVTSHEAFGWLAARYGLRQEAIGGISPDQEPDAKRLDQLTRLVQTSGTTTVFTETLVSGKVARTLAHEAGVRTAVLDPIESRQGRSYLESMRRDLAVLRAGLDCG